MIESIIEGSARNRGLVLALALVLGYGGWRAMQAMPLDAIPDLSDPQVIVFTEWMGRNPSLVEDQITYPLASTLLAAPHVSAVRGYSMFGMSFLYTIFEEGTDIYWARSRVLEYLASAKALLPDGVNPVLGPDATGVGWVYEYVLVDESGTHDLAELRALQDFTVRFALASVPGVSEVAAVGGFEREFQVEVDPNKLRAFGVTMDDLTRAVRAANREVGGRVLELGGRESYIRGRGYAKDIDDLGSAVLATRGAASTPVRVSDIGTVQYGAKMRRGLAEWNGQGEAVGAIVVMRHGGNALDVIDRVKERIASISGSLPECVRITPAYDRSSLIHRAIETLTHTLIEEGLVVALCIILFLLHLRSALLPILSIPLSVLLAFIPMYFLKIPATIMSLGGIAIAIGATVDAEIVMVEACHKKLEHAPPGANRAKLLAEAAAEVTPAIFFSLLIIGVSFVPVFGLNGQAGRLFRPLAMTKTFVMLAAAILSITVAPALRDYLIRGKIRPEARHPISRAIISVYRPFVHVALHHPKTTVLIGLFAILSAVPLAMRLGSEFMPPLEEGDMLAMPTTMPGISIEEGKRQLQRQDAALKQVPEVASVFGKIGRAESATDPAPLSMVETVVQLKPKGAWRTHHDHRWHSSWSFKGPGWLRATLATVWPEERPWTLSEVTADIDSRMQMPGWTQAWTMPIKTRIDMLTTGVRTPVGVKIFGDGLPAIEQVGAALEGILARVDGTRSAFYEPSLGGVYVDVVPDRPALGRLGLSVEDINRVIEGAIGGEPVSTIVDGRRRFSVNVRLAGDFRQDVDALRAVPVFLPARGTAPQGGARGGDRSMGGGVGGQAAGGGMGAMGAAPTSGAGGAGGSSGSGGRATGVPLDLRPQVAMGEASGGQSVPLGQLATIDLVNGPPMIKNEAGRLVGYVYVDLDQDKTDLGGYMARARKAVDQAVATGELELPSGFYLVWTGQYELMAQMMDRMKVLIPAALLLIVLLLWMHFRDATEVAIVLLSVPFALVGSVWLMSALDYRLSTAVWVGVIALVGLAAQTGIVMIVYIDHAYERRVRAGLIRNLEDIIEAHTEGTVQRVRPKLMTVSTMLIGLVPLLWATGSGADVMKRIAAPMVGGLLTSAFLTLEIIPVIYTYWRFNQLERAIRKGQPLRLSDGSEHAVGELPARQPG